MTDEKEKAYQADNALKSGIHRYLANGGLPADLQGYDVKLTARLLEYVGGEEKFLPMASVGARCMTVTELVSRYIDRTLAKVKENGGDIEQAVPILLPVLKIYNSYLEGSRRHLAELCLTPASVAKPAAPETLEQKHKEVIEMRDGKAESKENAD